MTKGRNVMESGIAPAAGYAGSVMAAPAHATETPERAWWLRVPAVLVDPQAVFAWFGADTREEADARQEPVLALIVLAGLAGILSLDATGSLLDWPGAGRDPVDPAVLPVLLFLQGAIYGFAAYWLGGLAFYLGLRGAGGAESFRTARHLLAYAAVPLVASLFVVWPVQLALYGLDAFRTDATDFGVAPNVFRGLEIAFVVWSGALLVVGIRVANRWSLARALGSVVLGVLALVGISLVAVILTRG